MGCGSSPSRPPTNCWPIPFSGGDGMSLMGPGRWARRMRTTADPADRAGDRRPRGTIGRLRRAGGARRRPVMPRARAGRMRRRRRRAAIHRNRAGPGRRRASPGGRKERAGGPGGREGGPGLRPVRCPVTTGRHGPPGQTGQRIHAPEPGTSTPGAGAAFPPTTTGPPRRARARRGGARAGPAGDRWTRPRRPGPLRLRTALRGREPAIDPRPRPPGRTRGSPARTRAWTCTHGRVVPHGRRHRAPISAA